MRVGLAGSIATTIVLWIVGYAVMGDAAMSIRTPLGRVRGLGSARSGTAHFWHQRLTAVANVFARRRRSW